MWRGSYLKKERLRTGERSGRVGKRKINNSEAGKQIKLLKGEIK
jgi:hypothetical protein